jgi:hypothetical protein
MAEMDRFEARLAASLERLADEVPTEVDPVELTAVIAAAGRRRSWRWPGALSFRDAPALWVALVLATVLALAFGMVTLAPRLVRPPFEPLVLGSMTCAGPPAIWGAGPLALDCVMDLPDERMDGDARIMLGMPADVGGIPVRPGTIELNGADAAWHGPVEVTTAPNGVSTGDAVLEGSGRAERLILSIHLVSADGTGWGLLGRVEARR